MDYLIAFVGAFLAGAVNTLSGNGSAITLTILMELLGLPADVANGTNRVGVLANSAASSYGFYRGGVFKAEEKNTKEIWRIIIITSIGAIAGIYLSLIVSNASYRMVFRYLLIVMLFVILFNPKKWLISAVNRPDLPLWVTISAFFSLGVYGGFIQMGMGVFFLAVMVLIAKYDIIQANAIKAVVIFLYTILAVSIYAWRDLIDWPIGLLMASGQMLGGYLTANYAARDPRAGVWAYRLLIVVIIAAIAKAFLF